MIAYLAIFGTAFAAFFGAPFWCLLLGTGMLFWIAQNEHRKLALRFAHIRASQVLQRAAWHSAGHALFACSAAYGIGYLSRLAYTL